MTQLFTITNKLSYTQIPVLINIIKGGSVLK